MHDKAMTKVHLGSGLLFRGRASSACIRLWLLLQSCANRVISPSTGSARNHVFPLNGAEADGADTALGALPAKTLEKGRGSRHAETAGMKGFATVMAKE